MGQVTYRASGAGTSGTDGLATPTHSIYLSISLPLSLYIYIYDIIYVYIYIYMKSIGIGILRAVF